MKTPVLALGAIIVLLLVGFSAYLTLTLTGELTSYRDGTTTEPSTEIPGEPEQANLTLVRDIVDDPGRYTTLDVEVRGQLGYGDGEFYLQDSGSRLRLEGKDFSPLHQGQQYDVSGVAVSERYCDCFREIVSYRLVSSGRMVVRECEEVIGGKCVPRFSAGPGGEAYCDCLARAVSNTHDQELGRMRIPECRDMEARCNSDSIAWGEPFMIVREILPL